jgi:hypothetical protein
MQNVECRIQNRYVQIREIRGDIIKQDTRGNYNLALFYDFFDSIVPIAMLQKIHGIIRDVHDSHIIFIANVVFRGQVES